MTKKATERRNIVSSYNSLRVQPFLFSFSCILTVRNVVMVHKENEPKTSSFSCDSILLSILFFYFGSKSQNIKQFKTFLSINMNIVEDFHILKCQECSFHKQFAWWRDDVLSSFQSN